MTSFWWVGRVIWINGAFSAGKTSVATTLATTLEGSFLLDPELIGVVLRDYLVPPAAYPGDFQDLALWRSFTRDAVLEAAQTGTVIVPMTIARSDYFEEIVGGIRAHVPVDHFTLVVSRDEILRREAARPDDTGGWAAKTVDLVLPELASARYAEHLDAESGTVEEIVAQIRLRIA